MIDIKTEVTINGEVFSAQLGTIRSTFLGVEDHGTFTFLLDFDFGGTGQAAGTYGLDKYDKANDRRVGTAAGMDLIMEILRVADVQQWEHLVGKKLYVLREDRVGFIVGILNAETSAALIFDDHFKDWTTNARH